MTEFLQTFMSHDAGPVAQFLKYAIGGGCATVVDMMVFYLMSWKVLPAMKENDPIARLLRLKVAAVDEKKRGNRFVINTLVAFIFSNFTAYVFNILFVFQSGKHPWLIELGLFYAVSGISIALAAAVGWVMIEKMHLSTTSSYVAKMVCALLINFAARKFFIFKG